MNAGSVYLYRKPGNHGVTWCAEIRTWNGRRIVRVYVGSAESREEAAELARVYLAEGVRPPARKRGPRGPQCCGRARMISAEKPHRATAGAGESQPSPSEVNGARKPAGVAHRRHSPPAAAVPDRVALMRRLAGWEPTGSR